MIKFWLLLCLLTFPLVLGQDYEDRLLHKKKKRPNFQQSSPCGVFRDTSGYATEDGRSIKVVAALGGAAAGYYLGMKHGNRYQQPVINNIINTNGGGGGYPCGGGSYGGGGGLLGSHLGGGGLLGSHLGGGGLLGGLTGSRNGVNWDRTIRQFNREVVRPITRWF